MSLLRSFWPSWLVFYKHAAPLALGSGGKAAVNAPPIRGGSPAEAGEYRTRFEILRTRQTRTRLGVRVA